MVIRPTARCFDDAIEYLAAALVQDPDWTTDHLRLVHAVCLMPDTGERFSHAWIEQDGWLCIQAGLVNGTSRYYAMERKDFEVMLRVQERFVYTVGDVLEKSTATDPGPWEPSILSWTRRQPQAPSESTHEATR